MHDVNTIGAAELTTPMLYGRQGDVPTTDGAYRYIQRALPGPGLEALAFMEFAPLSFSPIGPGFVNKQQLTITTPEVIVPRTIGVQDALAGGFDNGGAIVSQPLSNTADTFGQIMG